MPTTVEVEGTWLCKLARYMAETDEERRQRLQAALNNESIPIQRIQMALREWGYRIGEESIRRHRKGNCSCL